MAAEPLPDLDRRVLDYIRRHAREHGGRPPSVREVGAACGIRPPNNAIRPINRLVAGGHLERDAAPGQPARGFRLSGPLPSILVPVRGRVSCGAPAAADEDTGEQFDLAELFGDLEGLALYFAEGESMRDDGIKPGDLLFVRENPGPPSGSKVVARVGPEREMLLKRYTRVDTWTVRLDACNAAVAPLVIDLDRTPFELLGVLENVHRRERAKPRR